MVKVVYKWFLERDFLDRLGLTAEEGHVALESVELKKRASDGGYHNSRDCYEVYVSTHKSHALRYLTKENQRLKKEIEKTTENKLEEQIDDICIETYKRSNAALRLVIEQLKKELTAIKDAPFKGIEPLTEHQDEVIKLINTLATLRLREAGPLDEALKRFNGSKIECNSEGYIERVNFFRDKD